MATESSDRADTVADRTSSLLQRGIQPWKNALASMKPTTLLYGNDTIEVWEEDEWVVRNCFERCGYWCRSFVWATRTNEWRRKASKGKLLALVRLMATVGPLRLYGRVAASHAQGSSGGFGTFGTQKSTLEVGPVKSRCMRAGPEKLSARNNVGTNSL